MKTLAGALRVLVSGAVSGLLVNAAGKIVRSRPLCPFPQVAKHRGGPIEDAASFTCAAR